MVNVMLIDDHPVVRAGLRAILNAFPDIEVVLEGSDGSAVEQLTDADAPHIDVVVCDIQMPDVDGIAATRRVRELDGPPVLILTTYDTQADILAAVEAGALGYLLKDAPEETLHTAVLDTAAGKRTLAPEVTNLLVERLAQPETALSPRELEILQALSTGASNKQIAQRLFISEATVKTHLIHVYQKLGVETRTAAVSAAASESSSNRCIPTIASWWVAANPAWPPAITCAARSSTSSSLTPTPPPAALGSTCGIHSRSLAMPSPPPCPAGPCPLIPVSRRLPTWWITSPVMSSAMTCRSGTG